MKRANKEVVVVGTGTANMASMMAGIRRAGGSPRPAKDPDDVREAARVVLPGVGTIASAMERLEREGYVGAIAERLRAGNPLLAVCLGMQLLFEGSEESPTARGIGAVPGTITRFPNTVSVPQLGWNRVAPSDGCAFIEPGFAYFANSFRATEAPPGWSVATAFHGGTFISAIARGAQIGCQFHPELSGAWGARLLTRWIDAAESREVRPC